MSTTPRQWTYEMAVDRRKPSVIRDESGYTIFTFHQSGAAYAEELLATTVSAVNAYDTLTAQNLAMREALQNTLNGYGHVVGCTREQHPLNPTNRYCSIYCQQVRAALTLGEK